VGFDLLPLVFGASIDSPSILSGWHFSTMTAPSRSRVFLDISTDGGQLEGRLVIELFSDKTPKTCEKLASISFPSDALLTLLSVS